MISPTSANMKKDSREKNKMSDESVYAFHSLLPKRKFTFGNWIRTYIFDTRVCHRSPTSNSIYPIYMTYYCICRNQRELGE